MNNTIVKTFIGKHIDLSKVVAISDAEFIDRMGHGGWYVGFKIYIQLMDSPIEYIRELDYDEYTFDSRHEIVYGKNGNIPLAVERLQSQIDDLVMQWKSIASKTIQKEE